MTTIRGWKPWDSPDDDELQEEQDRGAQTFTREVRRRAARFLEPVTGEERQPDPIGLLTMADVIELARARGVKVSIWKLKKAIREGQLPVAIRGRRGRGHRHLLRVEDVEEWLEG